MSMILPSHTIIRTNLLFQSRTSLIHNNPFASTMDEPHQNEELVGRHGTTNPIPMHVNPAISSPKTFHQFPDLPTELRLDIYEQCLLDEPNQIAYEGPKLKKTHDLHPILTTILHSHRLATDYPKICLQPHHAQHTFILTTSNLEFLPSWAFSPISLVHSFRHLLFRLYIDTSDHRTLNQIQTFMTHFTSATKIEIYFENPTARFQDVFESKWRSLFYEFRLALRDLDGLKELVVAHGHSKGWDGSQY